MRLRRDDGATAVEFALVAPVVFLLMFIVMYAGIYFYYSAAASHIARVVARDASVPSHGSYPSAADEATLAHDAAGTLLPAPTSVELSADPSAREGNELTVTITYDLPGLSKVASLLPFMPHGDGRLTRTVTVRFE